MNEWLLIVIITGYPVALAVGVLIGVWNRSHANEAAEAVGAKAFAVGRSVYFGAGAYEPGSTRGRELLAHEVAHTVQQRGAAMPSLQGRYFYADYCEGWVRSFRLEGGQVVDHRTHALGDGLRITSFGTDAAQELYITVVQGRVYRLVPGT